MARGRRAQRRSLLCRVLLKGSPRSAAWCSAPGSRCWPA